MTFQRLQTVGLHTVFTPPSDACKLLILLAFAAFQRVAAHIWPSNAFTRSQVIDFLASNGLHTHTLYTTYIGGLPPVGWPTLEDDGEAIGLRPSIIASGSIVGWSMVGMATAGLASRSKISPTALVPMPEKAWGGLCAVGGYLFALCALGGGQ